MDKYPGCEIHPSAVIVGDVKIGEGTRVDPFCYIQGPTIIGKNNHFYPHSTIGTDCEFRNRETQGQIIIGDDNKIREHTTIQRGIGERDTVIGSRCYFMDHVHIAHDCLVLDDVTMAPNVVLAGHVTILNGANLGIGSIYHQFSTVGAYAMVGMGAVVTKDIPPFALVMGNPARLRRLNSKMMEKLGLSENSIAIENGRIVYQARQSDVDAFKTASRREALVGIDISGLYGR